jgi:predicted nucleic acid-binding protein
MNRRVADTNAVVYYLNQAGGEEYRRRFGRWIRDGVVISVVTRVEVLSWPGYSGNPDALADAADLLSLLREEPLTEPIVQATIALRRAYRLKIPDAIVAATAQVLALPLVTRNIDDFRRVPGLSLIDPFSP